MERFNKILNNSDTIEKFEHNWDMHMYILESMFQLRRKWCPIYMRNNFFRGMQNTQKEVKI